MLGFINSSQLAVISYQLSVISYQLSVISYSVETTKNELRILNPTMSWVFCFYELVGYLFWVLTFYALIIRNEY